MQKANGKSKFLYMCPFKVFKPILWKLGDPIPANAHRHTYRYAYAYIYHYIYTNKNVI